MGQQRAISPEILDRAIEIKQELPERSVRRIIRILEGEGIINKGCVSRSTLSRHLQKMGFGAKDFRNVRVEGTAARRFVKTAGTHYGRQISNMGHTYQLRAG